MINKTERVMDESFVKVFSKDQRLISTIALLMTLFILYTAAFGFFPSLIQRPVFVGFALVLAYLMHPHVSKKNRSIGIMGGVGVILAVICTGWVAINSDRFMTMGTESNAYDLAFAVILVLLLLEAARRTMGPILRYLRLLRSFMLLLGHGCQGILRIEALVSSLLHSISMWDRMESGVPRREPWLGWWRYLFCLVRSSRSLEEQRCS